MIMRREDWGKKSIIISKKTDVNQVRRELTIQEQWCRYVKHFNHVLLLLGDVKHLVEDWRKKGGDEQEDEEGGEWGRVKMGGCMAQPSQWRMPVIAMFIKLSFSTVVRFIKLSLSTGCIVYQRVILVKCLDRPILSLYEGMVKISIPKKLGDYECQ